MKVGDKIIYINNNDKHYTIYKIDYDFIPGRVCGYIKDDTEQSVYFRNDDVDPDWKFLKDYRKEKLNKLNAL